MSRPAARFSPRDTIVTGPPLHMERVPDSAKRAGVWSLAEVHALVAKVTARREAKSAGVAPPPPPSKPKVVPPPIPADARKGGPMDEGVKIQPVGRGGLPVHAAEVVDKAVAALDARTLAPSITRGPVQFGGVDMDALRAVTALAKALDGTGTLPKHIKSPQDFIAVAMAGHELGIPVMTAIRTIRMVEGRPEISYDMMLGLVKRAGYVVRWLRSDATVATIQIIDPRDPEYPHTETFTMEMAAKAGLATKTNWRNYPVAMLKARVASSAIRAYCPDVLANVYVEGEISDAIPNAQPLDRAAFAHHGADADARHAAYREQFELAERMRAQLEEISTVEAYHRWAWFHRDDFKRLTHADASTDLWNDMRALRVRLTGDTRPCPLTAATLQAWSRGEVDAPVAVDPDRVADGVRSYHEAKRAQAEARTATVSDEADLVNDWIVSALSRIKAEGVLSVWCHYNGYRFCRLGSEQKRAWAAVRAAAERVNQAAGEERVSVDDLRQWLKDAPEIPDDRVEDEEILDDPELNEF